MEHELEKVVGGHRCKTCGYTWTRKPKSRCVGMPLYSSPTNDLRTKTQWLTVKRQIKVGERPADCYCGYNHNTYKNRTLYTSLQVIQAAT